MFTYGPVNYDGTGRPDTIQRSDGAVVPISSGNADFQAFLTWNSQQQTPLDYTTLKAPFAQSRSIYSIITGSDGAASLNSLTSTQKTNVWNDFTANQRWKTDAGRNQAVLLLAVGLYQDGIIAAGSLNAKLWAVACYVQDNPNYLVTPSFDASINVPGVK